MAHVRTVETDYAGGMTPENRYRTPTLERLGSVERMTLGSATGSRRDYNSGGNNNPQNDACNNNANGSRRQKGTSGIPAGQVNNTSPSFCP